MMNLRRNKLLNNKDVVKENYHLMFGDCLERMKEIPDGSCVQMVHNGRYTLISFDAFEKLNNNDLERWK